MEKKEVVLTFTVAECGNITAWANTTRASGLWRRQL